jgi:hypothetical protein
LRSLRLEAFNRKVRKQGRKKQNDFVCDTPCLGAYMILFSKKLPPFAAIAFVSFFAHSCSQSGNPQSSNTAPIAPMPVDARIAQAVQQISAKRIQANIGKLVSFGTRSTISAQDAAAIASGRGVGAAREWIKAEFERYSKDCGGCLQVKTDSFTQQPADRVPQTPKSPMFMRCCRDLTRRMQSALCW